MNRQNSSKEGYIPPNIPPHPHSTPQMNSSKISGFLTEGTDSHPTYPGASPVLPSSKSSTITAAAASSVSSPFLSGQSINLAVELLNSLAGCHRDVSGQQLAQAFHGKEGSLQTLSQQIIALATAATGSSPSSLSSPPLVVPPVPVGEQHAGNKRKSIATPTDPATTTTTVANASAAATTTVTSLMALTTDLFSVSSGSSDSCRLGQMSDAGNSVANRPAGWASRLPSSVTSPRMVTAFQNAVTQLALLGLPSPGAHSVDVRSCTRAGGGESQTRATPGLGLSSLSVSSSTEFASRSDATKATEMDLNTQNGQCQPMDMSEPAFVSANKEAGGPKVIIRQTADADDHFFKALRGLKVDASPESKQPEQKKSLDQTSITAALIAPDSVQHSSGQLVVMDNGRSDAELAVDEHFKKSLAAFHVSPLSLSSSSSLPSVISTDANLDVTAAFSTNFPQLIPTSLYSLTHSGSETTPSGLMLSLSALNTVPALNSITTKLQTSRGKCARIQELANSLSAGVRAANHRPLASLDSVTAAGIIEQTQSGPAFTAEITATIIKDDSSTPQHIAQKDNGTMMIPLTRCPSMTSSGIDTVMEQTGHANLDKKPVIASPGGQTATAAHSFKPKKNWLAQYDVRQDDQKLSQAVYPTMPIENASGEAAATGSADGSAYRASPNGYNCKTSQSRDTSAQTATLSGAAQWTQTDLSYTFDQQRREKTCSPPASPRSSGSHSSPSPHSARSSDFELDLEVKSRAKQVPGKQNLSRRCPTKHGKRGSDVSDANNHQRKEKSTVFIVADNRPASSTSNHSPVGRQRKDKRTTECGIGTESNHRQLPPFQLNSSSKATSISPDRDCIVWQKPGVAAPTRSAATAGSTGSGHLKPSTPAAISCHTMPVLVSLVSSGSSPEGRSSDKDLRKPLAQAVGVVLNSEQRTASVAGAAEPKQDRAEARTEVHNKNKNNNNSNSSSSSNNNKEASGQPVHMYGSNSKSVSYWALPNTFPAQSFSSTPSSVHREGSATTAVTPISGITSGFFSGSTYSLDSSLGANHIIAFDNSVDTKSINSIGEGRNPCEPKVPTLPGLSSHSGETANQYTTGGVGKSLIEDDGECGEFREQKNQSQNQISCIWRKRASSEVSPWSTLKRSRSVITSSSSAENCDSSDSPSHECLADVNETLLPTTSVLLATSSRHSMGEIACSTNHIGRCLTPPETMATRDYVGFSNSRSEAGGQVQKSVKSFDSQLSSSRCCLRRGSCEPKANNTASTNSVPQTPSTTASVVIARSLSDTNSLSSFHMSHEEGIYLLR